MDAIKYTIKIISGNTLISVESKDFGVEIFKPEIINGKIQLANIVKQRRCCGANTVSTSANKVMINLAQNKHNNQIYLKNIQKVGTPETQNIEISRKSNVNLVTGMNLKPCNAEITNSQFVQLVNVSSQRSASNEIKSNHNENNIAFVSSQTPTNNSAASLANSADHFFKTPHKLTGSQFGCNGQKSKKKKLPTPKLGPNVKVIRLYRKPTENTPKKTAKLVPLNSSFHESVVCSTPKILNRSRRKLIPATPGTVTKWRKCITPVRTYSRQPKNQENIKIRRSLKDRKFLNNATVGYAGNAVVEIRTISAKIDDEITINNENFKQQLRSSLDLKVSMKNNINTKVDLYNASFTAFDLLTKPCRKLCLAKKFHRMFRRRCVQKYAPTDAKYKHLLDDIPPLTDIIIRRKRFSI